MAIVIFRAGKTHSVQQDFQHLLYLGADESSRQLAKTNFPHAELLDCSFELEAQFEKLRGPLLKWYDEYSQSFSPEDPFWHTTFSTRSSEINLFNLNCAFVALAIFYAKKYPQMAIVVECPWLALALQKNIPDATISSPVENSIRKLFLGKYYALRSFFLKIPFILNRFLKILQAKKAPPKIDLADSILIFQYFIPQSFEENSYKDIYFADLKKHLSQSHKKIHYLFMLNTPISFNSKIQAMGDYTIYQFARLRDLVSLFFYRKSIPIKNIPLEGMDVSELVRKEITENNKYNYSLENSWYPLLFKRMAEYQIRSLIFPFENHIWEKYLNLHCPKIHKIGYQHTTLPKNAINICHLSKSESLFLPSKIVSSNKFNFDILKSFSWPVDRLVSGGYFRASISEEGVKRPSSNSPYKVTFVLPGIYSQCEQIANDLKVILKNVSSLDFELFIKAHPAYLETLDYFRSIPHLKIWETNDLQQVLQESHLVVYTSSTLGLECRLLNIPILRYVLSATISVDPLPSYIDGTPPVTNAQTFLESVLYQLKHLDDETHLGPIGPEEFYTRIDYQLWESLIEQQK